MTVSINSALSAYQQTLKNNQGQNAPTAGAPPVRGFADLVKNAAQDVIGTSRTAEAQSTKAIQGTADLGQVVTAVASAELSLQTVVAVRDKVIEAYNEIIKMPV